MQNHFPVFAGTSHKKSAINFLRLMFLREQTFLHSLRVIKTKLQASEQLRRFENDSSANYVRKEKKNLCVGESVLQALLLN